ncbi:tryptophan biosynthesis modulator TrpM [Streptomyces lichenis]
MTTTAMTATASDPTAARPVRPAAGPSGCAVAGAMAQARDSRAGAPRDPYARLARGCRPRGCRAPARRVHGRRVRYVIGDEPGQVNGMRWRPLGAASPRNP